MNIVGKEVLNQVSKRNSNLDKQVCSLIAEIENANWNSPYELKKQYPKASVIGDKQVVFNLCWNRYRLWVSVSYNMKVVQIRKIGTHKEYQKWEIKNGV